MKRVERCDSAMLQVCLTGICILAVCSGSNASLAQPENNSAANIPHILASPERIALWVFDPKEGGQHVGRQLIRMPGGYFFLREPRGDTGDIAREFFRFSIQVKIAQRQAWLKEVAQRRAERKAGVVHVERKPLSAFFNDDTLSVGDVVVAAEGFRVFKGSAGFPYKATDFDTLENWQRSGAQTRPNLRAMERENRRRERQHSN